MRLITIGFLSVAMAAAGCNRAEPVAAASSPAATPTATSGTADVRPADAATPSAGLTASIREITVPAGTRFPVVLDTAVGSDISRIEQPVNAHLSRPLVVNGATVAPTGSRLSGVVTDAKRSGKVKGLAHVAIKFDTLTVNGERYHVVTSGVGRTAPSTKKKDALEIGGGAAGGALVGAIVGGKKGAAIGTAAGGGAGTALVLSTRGKEVRLPRGAAVTVRLAEPVTIHVKS